MLVVLQVTVTAYLWVLNPLSQAATDSFALCLSVDLLSFVMVSHLYRARRTERQGDSPWLALGCLVLIVLLASNLILG
jgi:hypothetical protein